MACATRRCPTWPPTSTPRTACALATTVGRDAPTAAARRRRSADADQAPVDGGAAPSTGAAPDADADDVRARPTTRAGPTRRAAATGRHDGRGAAHESIDVGRPGRRWPLRRCSCSAHLQPDLLLANTTPAGGDMGAHVWGPAYLRDHLLPHGRLTGWTPDWYAGFPAYQFYMVVPSLLDRGRSTPASSGWAALRPGAGRAVVAPGSRPRPRAAIGAVGIACSSIAGARRSRSARPAVRRRVQAGHGHRRRRRCRVVGLRLRPPGRPAASPARRSSRSAPLLFLFNRGCQHGNIIGGNMAVDAGRRVRFSICLSLGVLYLGFLLRGSHRPVPRRWPRCCWR